MDHYKCIYHAVSRLVIRDTDFIYEKKYLLLIKAFFIFNIYLYFINKSKVNIKFLEKKHFAKEITKWL